MSESTNEVYLFALQSSTKECHVAARNFLATPSSDEEATPFGQIEMLGPLLVARAAREPSLSVFMTDQEDQLMFMRKEALATAFKLPECAEDEIAGRARDFSIADTYVTVETCQG